MNNIITMTDSYKVTHWKQYPPKTEKVVSYFESRGGKFDETVFFGLQYFIKKYLAGQVVTKEKIDRAEQLFDKHLGVCLFNREGWEYILKEHQGRLPIEIRAVQEGKVIPTGNVLMTVENTDPNCFWLTNYLETLLVQVWYPTTVATQSREIKKVISEYMLKTGGTTEGIDFKLHDFGYRGVSSVESAGIGGAAHLVNFMGTDTIAALEVAMEYYVATMPGFSIPAAEHSTITSWGKENEVKAFENMLDKFGHKMVAVVSDSYNIYEACSELWGKQLKDKVLNMGGSLVVRPDSGDPPTVVVKVLELLGEAFGIRTTEQGYKVLNDKVRVIQGDGIDYEMVGTILQAMVDKGWAAENLAFGSGGGLLQKLNRDTQKFAFKCCQIVVDGEARGVYKDPVTSSGKRSKQGELALSWDDGGNITTVPRESVRPAADLLCTVFKDGEATNLEVFEDVRRRAKI